MITDKKILIIGAGLSGIGAARLLLEVGAAPVLYDGNTSLSEEAVRENLPKNSSLRIILGELPKKEREEQKWWS